MSAQGYVFEAQGDEYLTFEAKIGNRVINAEALADPMSLGFEGLKNLLEKPEGFRSVLSQKTRDKLMFLLPSGDDVVELFKGWLEATGIRGSGFGALQRALDHLDLVEADLHRYFQLDLADWFKPERTLSTRKLSVLILDLMKRPESAFGAEQAEMDPLSKLEIMFAQYYGGMTESRKPHVFMTTRQDRLEEQELEARRQRMLNRGLSA